jgi:hypothetical protein
MSRTRSSTAYVKAVNRLLPSMPQIHLDGETVERLDDLRQDDEEYEEIVTELINIYEAEELTLFHGGDEV